MWLQTVGPAPVLNTSDLLFAFGGQTGREIPLNPKGHPYCYEFVALEGTPLKVEDRISFSSFTVYRVSCSFYPAPQLYIDSRFVKPAETIQMPNLPDAKTLLNRMNQLIGTSYVWGGNWSPGIPELNTYFPPKGSLDEKMKTYWTLKGVDCSGLLYEASLGATPRNTHQLIHYGNSLKLKDLSAQKIVSRLEPLDMIIYPGHVLFALDSFFTIESKFPYGVILRSLPERLEELFQERTLVNEWFPGLDPDKHFMIRRFF